jgi:hypothetical protein
VPSRTAAEVPHWDAVPDGQQRDVIAIDECEACPRTHGISFLDTIDSFFLCFLSFFLLSSFFFFFFFFFFFLSEFEISAFTRRVQCDGRMRI